MTFSFLVSANPTTESSHIFNTTVNYFLLLILINQINRLVDRDLFFSVIVKLFPVDVVVHFHHYKESFFLDP